MGPTQRRIIALINLCYLRSANPFGCIGRNEPQIGAEQLHSRKSDPCEIHPTPQRWTLIIFGDITGEGKIWSVANLYFLLLQAFNGLIISVIMKYLSNIVRLFMIGSSMILTTVLSYVIFGYNVDVYFAFSFLMVMSALFLYHFDDGGSSSSASNGRTSGVVKTMKDI